MHIYSYSYIILFRGHGHLQQKNSLALAPDIKGNPGAAECLYTRGFLSKRRCQNTGRILMAAAFGLSQVLISSGQPSTISVFP